MTRVTALIVGPPRHGVNQLAGTLAAAINGVRVVRVPSVAALFGRGPDRMCELDGSELVHVHFTDQLFGDRCDESAATVEELAARLERRAAALSVTLHDVPLREDDPGRWSRRSAAYARVVHAASGPVFVNSQHEAAELGSFVPGAAVVVIALPIEGGPSGPPPAESDREVTVFGFVYPGKGHAVAIDALRGLSADVGVTALGQPASGHEAMTGELADRARRQGRRFTVTGYVGVGELPAALRRAAVPLVAHRLMSASGSIGSWLSVGRRPLVPDNPYTNEVLNRCPDSLTIYRDSESGLGEAIGFALDHPDRTWLAEGVKVGPGSVAVARAYRAEFDRFRG